MMELQQSTQDFTMYSTKMNEKKVLITGGLSFIFSHVTEYFVRRGYDVVVVDNCSQGSHPEIVDGSFKFHQVDLSTDDAFRVIIDEQPDYIVHAAAMTDVDYSIKNPRRTWENNVLATLNVFKAAKQLPKLIKLLYVNSDEVYGECETPKTEEDLMFPRNPYSSSKAACALIRTSYDTTYSSLRNKTAEIRMCNIFGPRQDTRKIMPLIIRALKTGESVPLQEGGIGFRQYLYVKNVPPIIELILDRGDRVYNVTNGEGYTVMELVNMIQGITARQVPLTPASRPSHDRWYRMDNTRLKSLGWNPLYTFEQGLREYLHYAQVV